MNFINQAINEFMIGIQEGQEYAEKMWGDSPSSHSSSSQFKSPIEAFMDSISHPDDLFTPKQRLLIVAIVCSVFYTLKIIVLAPPPVQERLINLYCNIGWILLKFALIFSFVFVNTLMLCYLMDIKG